MRKMIRELFLCSLILTAVGCSKENIVEGNHENDASFPLEITIPLSKTKVMDTVNEDKVNSLQVFVFRNNGALEAYAKSTDNTATVECTNGVKTILAIANAPDITDVTTKDEMDLKVSNLKENSKGSFVMYGAVTDTLSVSTKKLSIPVTRMVARVSIQKITNGMKAPQYAKIPIKLKQIYLINVAGDMLYKDVKYETEKEGSTYTPTIWYNKGAFVSSDFPSLLGTGDLEGISVTKASPYIASHYFYCYPNPSTSDTTPGKPGYTRLVVEVQIGEMTYYYPITIKGIQNNHTYNISELVITRLGSDSPNVPVTSTQATFDVTVNPWLPGSDESVTI